MSKNKICIERKKLVVAFFFVVIIIGLFLFSSLFGRQIILSNRSVTTKAASSQIQGGGKAKAGNWPIIVILFDKTKLSINGLGVEDLKLTFHYNMNKIWYCAGSLIGNQWVLTSTHCVIDEKPEDIGVGVGFYSFNQNVNYQERFLASVDSIIPFNPREPRLAFDDIALIKLKEPITGNPSTLSLNDNIMLEVEKTPLFIIGWGTTDCKMILGGPHDMDLHEAVFPIVSVNRANKPDWGNNRITENELAAGYPQGGVSSCKGDSGGPAMVWDGSKWVQVGITYGATGWVGGSAKKTTQYTKVRIYLDWIEKQTGIKPNSGTFIGTPPDPNSPQMQTFYERLKEFDEDDLQ